MTLDGLRVGYAPYTPALTAPGDRRRFCFYAGQRNIEFELADPSRKYDVVVLSERADILAWSHYRPGKAKIVYDLIDSYLALPRDLRSVGRGLLKFATGEISRPTLDYRAAIVRMCERADAVVCSTDEQRAAILPLCPDVHVILDHHESLVHETKQDYSAGAVFKLFWEGLPYTLGHFRSIAPALRDVADRHPIALHLMTDPTYKRFSGRLGAVDTANAARRLFHRVHVHTWDEQSLSRIAVDCDLGLIPLPMDDPMAHGKPENKLLLMWRMGLPTIATATPAYARAMQAIDVAMACTTLDDWTATLERYIDDEAARREAGTKGREFAESRHSEQALIERWDRVFEQL